MTYPPGNDNRLGWMLDDALEGVPHARHAILIASDGLLLAHSAGMHRDLADSAAAGASATASLARNRGPFVGGGPGVLWKQDVSEYGNGYLLIRDAGANAVLAATAGLDVVLGQFSFRLEQLVQRLGPELSSPARQDAESS